MMDFKDLREWALKVKDLWHHPSGLFGSIGLVASVLIAVALWAHPVARDDLQLLTGPAHHYYFFGSFVLLFAIGASTVGYFWNRNRKLPRLPNGKPSIIFALSSNNQTDADGLVKQVYDGFRKEILNRNLQGIIHYKVLPKNLEVHNHDQANQILSESEATIVVFGDYQTGKRSSKVSEQFSSLSFHWRGDAPLNKREQALVAAMEQFPFRIDEADSLDHTPRARQGFANLTLFFVALSLTSIGNTIDARLLWGDLITKEKRVRSNGRNISIYRNWWARNEFAYAQYVYKKYLVDHLTDPSANPHAEDMLKALKSAKEILSSFAGYYMLKAIAEFHLCKPKEADRTARDGLKRSAKNSPANISFNLSLGFITMWRKLYDRSIRYYRAVVGHGYPKEEAERVIRFVQTVLNRHPDRPELHFTIAFIRDTFGHSTSCSDYEYFLDQAAGVSGIEKLVHFSEERIRRISANQAKLGEPQRKDLTLNLEHERP